MTVLISHKYKFIHVHIPKTGGSSANGWIKSIDPDAQTLCERGHEPIGNIIRLFPTEASTYTTFAIVRNPWARVVSLYHYRKLSKTQQPPHWPSRTDIELLSFKQVVLNSLSQNPLYADICPPRDAPQIAWLQPACFPWLSVEGEIAVDYVCKIETIEQDIARLANRLGFEAPRFPHVNQSEHAHYSSYYDAETQDIVAKKYEIDITKFNYAFSE